MAPNASDEEITAAYKRLARKYHPDLNPGDTLAEEKMKDVNAAYDEIKRIRQGGYDAAQQNRQEGYHPHENPYGNPYGNFYGYRNGTFNGFSYGFDPRNAPPRRYVFRFPRFSLLRAVILFLLLQLLMTFVLDACSLFYYGFRPEQPQQNTSVSDSVPEKLPRSDAHFYKKTYSYFNIGGLS